MNTEQHRELVDFQTQENSFQVLLCTEGCGVVCGQDVILNFFKGDCVFVSANSIPLKIHGKAHMPCMMCEAPVKVKKIVGKVRIAS